MCKKGVEEISQDEREKIRNQKVHTMGEHMNAWYKKSLMT